MNLVETLKQLVDSPSPSGFERNAQNIVSCTMAKFLDKISEDIHGNLICVREANNTLNAKTIMLMAHIDEVGMMVTYVEPCGLVRFTKIGGIDAQLMLGRSVSILHEDCSIKGVVGSLPIHMKNKDAQKNSLEFSEMWIDIGVTNREDAFKKIQIGDPIVIDSSSNSLSDTIVASRGCDDKAGVTTLIRTAEILKDNSTPNKVVFVTSVQEEIGTRGAMTASYNINPDVCIVIDVTHATDYPNVQKSKYGEINLGKGVVIPLGSDLSTPIQRQLMDIATERKIPFQRSALPGPSGTDAHAVQVSKGGCLTGLLSIPCRYMHTPVECISIVDLEHAAELLAAFCEIW